MLEKFYEIVNLKDVLIYVILKFIILFCVFGLVYVIFNGRVIIYLIN